MKRIKLKALALAIARAFARPFARYAEKNLVLYNMERDYSLADLDRYDVNAPGAVEKVRQRLFDFQIYPTAGTTQMTFFAQPKGQGNSSSPGNAGNVKTYADTNMELAGQLPSPQAFIAESIEIVTFAGSSTAANTFATVTPMEFSTTAAATVDASINDVNAIGVAGWLDLYIGSKTYLRDAPLGAFPPKTFLALDAAVALQGNGQTVTSTMATIANAKWSGRPYYLDPPITLRATQNFNITLNWPVAVATPSGFNARIGVILDGVLFRKAQ